jgi:hypothetical protein
MGFLEGYKLFLLYFSSLTTLDLPGVFNLEQHPISLLKGTSIDDAHGAVRGPKFRAPNGPESGKPFECQYPALGKEWTSCSTRDNRGCWLRSSNGDEFNISTDYESVWPEGITREVSAAVFVLLLRRS